MFYQCTRRISGGALTELFEGLAIGDDGFKRPVVIKMLRPEYVHNQALVERMRREAGLLARVRSPGIPEVLTSLVLDGQPSLIMERVAGMTVGEWVRTHGDDPAARSSLTVEVLRQAAETLHDLGEALGRTFIHGDVSPANLMVSGGAHPAIRLIDMGEAALIDDDTPPPWQDLRVTPGFCAPELPRTGPSLAADIYALGAVARMICVDPPAPIAALLDDMTAEDPTGRPGSWADVLLRLGWKPRRRTAGVAAGSRRSVNEGPHGAQRPAATRRVRLMLVAALALVCFGAALLFATARADRPQEPSPVVWTHRLATTETEPLADAGLSLYGVPETVDALWLDGNPLEELPSLLRLAPGPHHLEALTCDGYRFSAMVSLTPGEVRRQRLSVPRTIPKGDRSVRCPGSPDKTRAKPSSP